MIDPAILVILASWVLTEGLYWIQELRAQNFWKILLYLQPNFNSVNLIIALHLMGL